MTDNLSTRLAELARRCERASGPDRELDIAIALAQPDLFFNAGPEYKSQGDRCDRLGPDGSRVIPGNAPDMLVPRYTASLDAAMTLVPDGWALSLGEMMGLPLERRWRCHLRDHREPYNPATCAWLDRDCRTPALAICAAALWARTTQGPAA